MSNTVSHRTLRCHVRAIEPDEPVFEKLGDLNVVVNLLVRVLVVRIDSN